MTKRKSLSKKIRFDVFKRDGFKCAYCGKSPPLVVLEIDHITPVSKGGDNGINNLLTACFDCNRGKTNATLDTIPPTLSKKLEILQEKETQLSEYNKFLKRINSRMSRQARDIEKVYSGAFPEYRLSKNFKMGSIKNFLKKLTFQETKEAMEIAVSRIHDPDDSIKYFCGICWRRIEERGIEA